MFHKTKGVVLHSIEYSETSLIVKIFTREFGLQSYIVKGSRSKKTKQKVNLFQTLTLLDLEVTHSDTDKLARIVDIGVAYHYAHLPYDIIKSSVAVFVNEVIYKSLQGGHPDEGMFDYIENALKILDVKDESCSNFHLFFMIGLSRYLGFYPQGKYGEQHTFFDLQEGQFSSSKPFHAYSLSNPASKLLYDIMSTDYESIHLVKLDNGQRRQLLNALILYYQLHIESFKALKSQEVLQQVIE